MHNGANDTQLMKLLMGAKVSSVDSANWGRRPDRPSKPNPSRSPFRTSVHPAAVVALVLALAIFAGSAALAWRSWL
jgi:hypothetical protein